MIDVSRITSILKIKVDGQKSIILTEDQAEELCIKLEQMLFDEPTYDQLNDLVMDLKIENEKLKEELENLNVLFEDKLDQRLGRRYI
ncbi:hypothetical protein [Garciella nitratireducens]|uniref:Uncharacterized protein n=1 Tax=Garciella nitratireducens DSM 15102 TaxID=1121911 RepID=A0A1T4K7M4_9FIRM|nr:hypothetical protein [Garciella nitratireducens]SJZ38313.1 hypothetical protein SAMN02745973_00393 [Garciella nitratireducens DSM 15102]